LSVLRVRKESRHGRVARPSRALLPGAYHQPGLLFTGPTVRISGGVAGSETVLIDGMDGTNILGQGANQQNQPSMDSIQEWTVSNNSQGYLKA